MKQIKWYSSGVSGNSGAWGTHENIKIKKEILDPLGLTCYGGKHENNKITYYVTNNDKTFDRHLTENEFNNIEYIYNIFLRKKKLQKLSE